MNRAEIENQIKEAGQKVKVMKDDLQKFAADLSATSQVAIIARIVLIEKDIEEFKGMLEFLDFEEIVKGEFDEK